MGAEVHVVLIRTSQTWDQVHMIILAKLTAAEVQGEEYSC